MEKRYFIGFFTIVLIALTNCSFSQYSIGGGVSSFLGLNNPISRFGLNAFVEIPRTSTNTLMIRAAYMLPNKNTEDVTVSGNGAPGVPAQAEAIVEAKTSYFAIDGGSRFYFINDYDLGFSMFAGGYLKGILSSYSAQYRMKGGENVDDYVTSGYPSAPLTGYDRQFSVLFAFGGTIGAKYQLIRGALVFDLGIEIITRLLDPSAILGNEISPLSLNLNLAYRFDWY